MNYEEWINFFDILKKSNNEEVKNKLLNEYNDNLRYMLIPKIIELVKYKFNIAVQSILNNLDNIFDDSNMLDMSLVKLKKDLLFIYELTNMKELDEVNNKKLKSTLKKETQRVYDILSKEATKVDPTGVLNLTIKNNIINWGDDNEL